MLGEVVSVVYAVVYYLIYVICAVDRLCSTFNQSDIVSIAVSCAIFQLFDWTLKNIVTLTSILWITRINARSVHR